MTDRNTNDRYCTEEDVTRLLAGYSYDPSRVSEELRAANAELLRWSGVPPQDVPDNARSEIALTCAKMAGIRLTCPTAGRWASDVMRDCERLRAQAKSSHANRPRLTDTESETDGDD